MKKKSERKKVGEVKEKPVFYFSDEYLKNCQKLSTMQIVKYLDDFRIAHSSKTQKLKSLEIKIPEKLISVFKLKAKLEGKSYHRVIQELMKDWTLR